MMGNLCEFLSPWSHLKNQSWCMFSLYYRPISDIYIIIHITNEIHRALTFIRVTDYKKYILSESIQF